MIWINLFDLKPRPLPFGSYMIGRYYKGLKPHMPYLNRKFLFLEVNKENPIEHWTNPSSVYWTVAER